MLSKLSLGFLLGIGLTIGGDHVLGQIRPSQPIPFPLPPSTPTPLPTPQPLPETPLELTPPNLNPPQNRPDIPGTITVIRFEFVGNSAFSKQELERVTAPYTNRPITFAELLQAEAAVTKLYTEAGYINSGAVIPAQQKFPPTKAVVKIQIIEGGIEEIRVTVDGRLHSDYVRSRLTLATTKPLNQKRLLEALQLLQLDPLIATISADLSAGSRPELGVLSVKVKEARTFNIDLFADNGRVESIGRFERGIRFRQDNLLGFGDGLQVQYANTDGSNLVYASYRIPINPRNGTIQLTTQYNSTRVIDSPFDQLDITGYSLYYDLSVRQPLLQTPTQELALGMTLGREESKTNLLGQGFPLSPGADNNGRTQVNALRLFQEWTRRSSKDVLAMRSQFSFGVDAFGATTNPEPPDARFFDWLAQGQYVRQFAPDTLLVVRSSLQLSADPLVSIEQFTLGGLYSVRGYRQNLLLTDNGVFASAEMRLPVARFPRVGGVVQLVPFVDFGVGWNDAQNPIPTPSSNTLVSVGLGLQGQLGDNFSARLDWGIPLISIELPGDTSANQALYFTLNYSLF